jgi:hypothetical protein
LFFYFLLFVLLSFTSYIAKFFVSLSFTSFSLSLTSPFFRIYFFVHSFLASFSGLFSIPSIFFFFTFACFFFFFRVPFVDVLSPPKEASSCSARQEILCLYYRVHMKPATGPFLSRMNSELS